MYIDKINWNPSIDPKMIEELDRSYFAPIEEIKYGRQSKNAKKSSHSDGYNRSQHANDNPWECDNMQGSSTFKDGTHGWKQWGSHDDELRVTSNNENAWETSYPQVNGTTEIADWGQSRDSSWGWNIEGNNTSLSKFCYGDGNYWKHWCEPVSAVEDKGWSDVGNNNFRGGNYWESRNYGDGDNTWNGKFVKDAGDLKNIGKQPSGPAQPIRRPKTKPKS